MNQPFRELQSIILGIHAKKLGRVTRVTPEHLYVSVSGGTQMLDYRIGYRVGTRVVLDENGMLLGKAPSPGQIKLFLV